MVHNSGLTASLRSLNLIKVGGSLGRGKESLHWVKRRETRRSFGEIKTTISTNEIKLFKRVEFFHLKTHRHTKKTWSPEFFNQLCHFHVFQHSAQKHKFDKWNKIFKEIETLDLCTWKRRNTLLKYEVQIFVIKRLNDVFMRGARKHDFEKLNQTF